MPPQPARSKPPAASDAELPLWRHPEFGRGLRDMAGLGLGLGAWALVTGVAMVDSGLPLWAALAMSLLVFAGTAQLASAPLIATGAPLWVVWLTALALNLRFVIFSASWRPYFEHLPKRQRLAISYVAADLNFVMFMKRFPRADRSRGQLAYFWGTVGLNYFVWHAMSLLGIALASRVPTHWGLGFAGTLALLGMTYSLLNDRSTWVPAAVAASAAVAAFALPLKMNMLVAIAAAMAVGLMLDRLGLAPRAAPASARPVPAASSAAQSAAAADAPGRAAAGAPR